MNVVAMSTAEAPKNRPIVIQELLTPAEVAQILRVDPKTVTRWARDGRLTSVRTPGGHRRYIKSEILGLLEPGR